MQRNDFGKTSDSTAPRAMVSENAVIAAKDAEIARLTDLLNGAMQNLEDTTARADQWQAHAEELGAWAREACDYMPSDVEGWEVGGEVMQALAKLQSMKEKQK